MPGKPKGIASLPKGVAPCPGCGQMRRAYLSSQGWRVHSHGDANAHEWCIGPGSAPPIDPDSVRSEVFKASYALVLGQVLAELRRRRGLRQAAVAKELNLSGAACSRIESGLTRTTVAQLRKFARVLGTEAWRILRETDDVAQHLSHAMPSVSFDDDADGPGLLPLPASAIRLLVAGRLPSTEGK